MPRLDELREPASLQFALWIRVRTPAEDVRLFCTRCELVTIEDPEGGFSAPTPCVIAHGMTRQAFIEGKTRISGELIIPCRYVLSVSLGPKIDGERRPARHRAVMHPDWPADPEAMTVSEIEAALVQLREERE